VIEANEEYGIEDIDATGFYPNLILTQELYPAHIGKTFLEVYKSIVDRRTAAKHSGNKVVADSLKIVANSTYGKFGSRWSVLYSPALVIQVTVTGQLGLLMLIERLSEIDGVEVTSANTDGITYRYRRTSYEAAQAVIKEWESYSGLSMERVSYQTVYSRDVSNYVAVLVDGKAKLKGVYNYVDRLDKNPDAQICSRAVVDYLTLGASIEATVELCDDLRQFVCVRKVTGGAMHKGVEIGKVIRWYYTKDTDQSVLYKVNEHQVPDTFGAGVCVTLPAQFPENLDRWWYKNQAREMVRDLGVPL
jgi:DNA polymerase elongation subunit (family B)